MLENGQTYLKNLVEFPTQDFYSIFGHFSTLSMKGLKWNLLSVEIYKPTKIGDKYSTDSLYQILVRIYKMYKGLTHATNTVYEHVWDHLWFQINSWYRYYLISCHWSLLIPPANIRKPQVFWWFQGVSKEISGMKWVNHFNVDIMRKIHIYLKNFSLTHRTRKFPNTLNK